MIQPARGVARKCPLVAAGQGGRAEGSGGPAAGPAEMMGAGL